LLDPFRLAPHDLVRDPRVPLRGHDTRVSENLLESGEASAAFKPPARERVA
jgi:hypothetical protein